MDASQLRKYIVRPALKCIGLYSDVAEDLVMGTAAQESHLEFVKQLGGGPALSLFQIEPATHVDYWTNYLAYREELSERILKAVGISDGRPDHSRLVWDLRYSAMMCRIHYRRIRSPLPQHGDVEGYAHYWKKYYNTSLGAGTEEEFMKNWKKYILQEG